jgi:hypothetical protein
MFWRCLTCALASALLIGYAEVARSQSKNMTIPADVRQLETVFGKPSQSGFGTTVLFDHANHRDDLERLALEKYKYFTGNLWEKYGQAAWMGSWRMVHEREGAGNIVSELHGIEDVEARRSASAFLDGVADPQETKQALSQALDDRQVENVMVFNVGDGEALSGILLAARGTDNGAFFIVFILD